MMKKNVVITGVGLIGDFGVGKKDFSDFLLHKTKKKKIHDFNFNNYIDTTLLRKADNNSCFAAVSANLAIEDAQLNMEETPAERWGLIIGTTHGPLDYAEKYHRELVIGGPRMASPLLFSNSVLNAMASYISTIFHIRGYTTTLNGYNTVSQAIQYAVDHIAEGIIDVCLVVGVDIFHDILTEAYSCCMDSNCQISDRFGGSGILILESFESARKRGVRGYGQVLGSETITADYIKSMKNNISPIKKLLNKLEYKIEDINCVITSCYNSKESLKRQNLYLKDLGENIPVVDCSPLFGCTFSAAEIFKIILGVLSIKGNFPLTEICTISSEKWPLDNILINSVDKICSNSCLLLERI